MSRTARVTFSYKAEQDDELSLEVGDVIKNIVDTDVGWCEGELNGKRGMFPNNFVEEIVVESSDNNTDSVAGKKARVTFDYDAQDKDELTLKVGEIVNVVGEEEAGWWKGQLANKTGVFPSNFVELIDQKDAAQMETQHKHSVEATAPSVEHLDGLLDEEEAEIKRSSSVGASSKKLPGGGMGFGNLISADILAEKRLKKVHHDDKKEKKEKSSVLHAEPSKSPSTVKTKAPATSAKSRPAPPVPQCPPSKKPSERAKVMFPYEPENPDELNLVEGDVITILNKDVPESDGWWEGEINGKVGMFPNNFVELLPAEEEDATSVKDKAPVAPATAKKGVPVLPVNLDELKKSPKTHKKPAPSVSAKDDSDSEKTAHKVTPREPPKKPVSSHPPKEEPNVDHTPEMAHPAPAKKPVAPQKPTLPPKKPLPIKAKKPDIIGRKPEKKADTEKSAPLKKTAEDAVDGSHVKEMSHVQERSKPVDKKSTPEIKTSDTGEAPISFDDPPETETLNHLTANRAKVPQKRPPSKEGRLGDSARLSGNLDDHLTETIKQPPSRPKEPPKEPAWKRDAREAREKKQSLEEKAPPPILASKTDALEKRKSVHKEETHEQMPPVQKVEPFTTTSPAEVEKLRKEVSGLREKLEKMEKKFNESLKKQEDKFRREIEVLTNDFDEEKKQNAAELAALKVELNILKKRQSRLNLDDTQ